MTKKRVVRRKKTLDLGSIMRDYLLNRSMRERSDSYEKEYRGQMMDWMEEHGTDIELDEPLEFTSYSKGQPKKRTIAGVKRIIRHSKSLNSERAEAFLRKKGMWEDCVIVVESLDENAVIRKNFDGEITDKELDALYDERFIPALELTDE